MDFSVPSVQSQYTHGSLQKTIDLALKTANRSVENPTLDDLAPVDGFHIGGRKATHELLDDLPLPKEPTVLDVGSGLGGTARILADAYDAEVVGVDLSEEHCEVARELTRRVQLDDEITFRQGDALNLSVDSGRFDLVVSEHVQMNVSDKQGYMEELARVLRPEGLVALYEVFAGADNEPHFPVPWADRPALSFLAAPDAFREIVEETGLEVLKWTDCTEERHTWVEKMLKKVEREGLSPIGTHLLMGSRAKEKMSNVARNLAEDRIRVVSATFRKPE